MVSCSITSRESLLGTAPPIVLRYVAIRICLLSSESHRSLCCHFLCASVDLSTGYLFQPLTSAGKIINKQIANSTLQSRLRYYLRGAHIYDGETLHSFRAGIAITLALSGSQLTDIMEHIGWRHAPTASHYLKVAAGPSPPRSFRVAFSQRLFGPGPCCVLF